MEPYQPCYEPQVAESRRKITEKNLHEEGGCFFRLGSQYMHDKMVEEIYESLEYDDFCSDRYKWIREIEYMDPDASGRKVVGEMDLCGVPEYDRSLVYLEVKSSYKQKSKGRKQIKRAEEFWQERYGMEVEGLIILPDYDFEDIKRFLS